MYIANITIQNFRGIQQALINFTPNSILIGPNNCGKTTVIEAMALLIGRDRMVKTLTEHDFYGSEPSPTCRIHIMATLTDFESENPNDHTEWFGFDRGVPKWYDALKKIVLPTKVNAKEKLACQIAFSARFDRAMLEVETIRYFYDGNGQFEDVFAEESVTPLSRRITTDLGFFLVPASRSWDKVISFASDLFKKLISAGDGTPAEAVLTARDGVRRPSNPLEKDKNLAQIVSEINDELAAFFSSRPQLELRLTSTDSEGVLEAVVSHFTYEDSPHSIPSRRHGNGLISLQWLLLLLQFGKLRNKEGHNFIMALEEPELHIPPALQRKLVHRLQALSSQSIITTHSPTIAAISDPVDVLVMGKYGKVLQALPLLDTPLRADAPNSIRKLFQLNRVDTISALMHDWVLVPEGRTEFDWLRLLTRAVDLRQGWVDPTSNEFGVAVGIIPTHDAAVVETYGRLKGLHRNVACLVDGDKDGKKYLAELKEIVAEGSVILRWKDDWTLEDVIGWILEADEKAALAVMTRQVDPKPVSISQLVLRLKENDRGKFGLKSDMIAYESIVDAIYEVRECNLRAQRLLNGVSKALMRKPDSMFKQEVSKEGNTFVFTP